MISIDFYNQRIDHRSALVHRIIIKDDKRRTEHQNKGNNVRVHQRNARRHGEHKPPDQIHGTVKPCRFNGTRHPTVDFYFQPQLVDERMQAEKHHEGQNVPKTEGRKQNG